MRKLFLLLSVLFVVSCTKDPIIYTLTTSANPYDGGTVSPSTQQYDEGKTATITATALSEYLFQSWSGATGSSNTTSLVMSSDKSVTANFVKKKYALTTAVEGEGTVTEKVIKAGAATDYNSGTIVELTANPSAEWMFVEWTGDLTGSENPKEITIDKAKSVTAVFVKKQYALTIEIEGEGTVDEKVIKDGSATDYNSGTIVELTATATEDWEFVEWTGNITSTENPVQITIDEAKTVKAKFMRYFNYNVPSHDWKHNIQPWIDLFLVISDDESRIETSNTGVAYADFNEDGYLDILTLQGVPDGEFGKHNMFINNGDDTFTKDNSLLTNPDFEAHGPRKTIVGDFNGDNKPDVVRIGGGHDTLENSNILMSGTDNYTFSFIDVVPESQYHGFASGDLDNDGDLDLFFGQPESGFAMNDGSGNFTWFRVDEKISNFFEENTFGEVIGPYGIQTVEILDVNQDGNLDIVIGGSYADNDYDYNLMGPTILWGDGSSNYDYDNKTEIWGFGEKPTIPDGSNVDNNDDISFADINNDGYLDVVLTYIRQIDNDPNNGGNTTMSSVLQIFKGGENNEFTDVTNEWTSNPLILLDFPITWLILRDIDNNGMIDMVESEKVQSRPGGSWGNSIRWEWNGNGFTKIN